MAKRKRTKGNSFAKTLKFEVYGILLMAISIIALSGEAAVGRSLTKLFGAAIGIYHFIFPLIGIYIGLLLMIKRAWPGKWTSRATGILLLVLGLTLLSAIRTMDTKLAPVDGLTAQYIFQTLSAEVKQSLLSEVPAPASGGYVGALQFMILYSLFGYFGSYFVMMIMLSLSFIMITRLSYVDLVRMLKSRLQRLGVLLGRKIKNNQGKSKQVPSTNKRFIDDEDDEEIMVEPQPQPLSRVASKRPKLKVIHSPSFVEPAPPKVEEASIPEPPVTPIVAQPVEEQPPAVTVEAPLEEKPPVVPLENPFASITPTITDDLPSADSDPAAEDSVATSDDKSYQLPSLTLLATPPASTRGLNTTAMDDTRLTLESTLASFGVRASVLDVVRGPAVTRYEVQPATGVKVSKIVNLTDDIALALAAKDIRMEAPIPGKSAIGIEVPNSEVSVVTMREVMETALFMNSSDKLAIAFGRDISGQPIVANLAKMPHLLVAGATGSGKSVCINGIITSILYKARPDEVKFLMIDPKMVELNVYNGIPHLLAPVVTDPKRASLALKKIVVEMEKRYELFSKSGTRNMEGYNALMADRPEEKLPFIVVIVDELADLMMVAAGDVEEAIMRLAQMARAAGIHLIIATQRPSVDVITGIIKANIPSRIAFGVSSQIDSRTILDSAGAEKLLGRGDMLFLPVGMSKPVRVQGAFLSDQEVEKVVSFCRTQGEAEYKEDLVPEVDDSEGAPSAELDEFFIKAVRIALEDGKASASWLQRRLSIGYNRAARLVDEMESRGIIGKMDGSKPRDILMTWAQFEEKFGNKP